MKKKDCFKIILSAVIISQLIITPHFIYAQDNQKRVIVDGSIESNPVEDIGFLTKQARIDFGYSGDTRVEVSRVSLSKLNMSLDKPQILNPYTDLRYEYHKDTKELWIVYSIINKKTKKQEDICAHVFEGVILTSNVAIDQNMMAFATPEGIRITLIERILNTGFIEPVLVPLISPKGLKTDEVQYNISSIQFINTNSTNLAQIFKDEPNKQLYAGDLLITQASEDGTKSFHSIIDRFEVVTVLRNQLIGLLFLTSLYMDRAEQQDLVEDIESILSKEIPLIDEYYKKSKEVFSGGQSDDLIIHTLKNMGAGDTLKSLKALLSTPSGVTNSSDDVMVQYTKKDRKLFTPSDVENIQQLVQKYKEATGKSEITAKDFDNIETIYVQSSMQEALESFPNINEATESLITRIQEEQEKTWNEKVQEYTESVSDKLDDGIKQKDTIYKKVLDGTKKLFSRFYSENKKLIKGVGIGVIILELYDKLKACGVHIVTDQIDWIVHGFQNILNYPAKIPGIQALIEPVQGFLTYIFGEWTAWNLEKLLAGTALAISLYPITMYLAKLFNKSSNQNTWQAFFNFGIKYYAKLCYPITKVIFDKIGQKNIYSELARGLKPVFTKIGLSQAEIDKIMEKKTDEYLDHQDSTLLSKVLAASIVEEITSDKKDISLSTDEKLTQDYSYMTNIIQLLSKDPSTQFSYILDIVGESDEKYELLNYIATYIYDLLIKAEKKKGARKISKEALLADIQSYLKLKTKIVNDPSIVKPESTIKKTIRHLGSFFSKSLPAFFIYGQSGLEINKKFKNVQVDEATAEIAGMGFKYDFIASTLLYAGVATDKFAIPSVGNWEIAANQGGQVFIFGVQGAYDPLSVAASNVFTLPKTYQPKTDAVHKYEKKQTVKESIKTALTISDSLSTQGYLATHAKYIKNFAEGFSVRFVVDFIPRLGAKTAIAIAAGTLVGLASIPSLILTTGLQGIYFLVAKICLTPFFIGYFVIWASVVTMMKKNESKVSFYTDILNRASNLLNNGVKFNDVNSVRKAVVILKSLYYSTKTPIDPKWQKPTDQFSIEDGISFNEYVKENLPVSTIISKRFGRIVNIGLGSFISTVLFNQVSSKVYDTELQTLDSLELLVFAVGMLALTYVELIIAEKGVSKFTTFLKEYVDSKDPDRVKSLTKIVDDYIEISPIDNNKVKQVISELVNNPVFDSPKYLSYQELYNLVLTVEDSNDCISMFSKEDI